MTAVAAIAVAIYAAGPAILAPGPTSQSTQPRVRFYVQGGTGALSVTVGGKPAGECDFSIKLSDIPHCWAPLEPGLNEVKVTDADGATAAIQVTRYVTTGPLLPGVDTRGFGPGTLHRPEVEAVCAGCHAMGDYIQKDPQVSLEGTQCASCHRSLWSRDRQHGPVGQAACLMCHDPKAPQRYGVRWPIQETCFVCHQDIKGQMMAKAFRHGPTAAGRCTTCHDPHGSDNPFWLKKPIFDLCTNCHPEKAVDRHVVVGFVFGDAHPLRGRPHPRKPGQELACSGCHNPHAAEARFLWQYDATVREDLCRSCHPK